MTQSIDAVAWVYVAIQNPGSDETIVGQRDEERDIAYIPVFKDRDAALQGVFHLAKEPGRRLEIQAIIFEDLVRYAQKEGFLLFLVDGQGRVTSKLTPDGRLI
jgi:hypothetical protein